MQKTMHHNLQLGMEKLRVAPFFIPTAKYVVCAPNKHFTYFAQNKSISFLFIPKSLKNLIKLVDVSP